MRRIQSSAIRVLPALVGRATTETALVQLLRRKLDDLHQLYATWLLDMEHSDERVAERLREDEDFDGRVRRRDRLGLRHPSEVAPRLLGGCGSRRRQAQDLALEVGEQEWRDRMAGREQKDTHVELDDKTRDTLKQLGY